MALDTRLALIDKARTGLDVQTNLLGDDSIGHQILQALRDAAQRGVRVRLLVDDLYTAGIQRQGKRLSVAELLDQAHERVVIVSPYFLPSSEGLARMRSAQARGVSVQVITNSLLDSDEPLVSMA